MSGTTAQLPPLWNGTSEGFLGSNENGEGVLSVEFQIGLLETTWDELST